MLRTIYPHLEVKKSTVAGWFKSALLAAVMVMELSRFIQPVKPQHQNVKHVDFLLWTYIVEIIPSATIGLETSIVSDEYNVSRYKTPQHNWDFTSKTEVRSNPVPTSPALILTCKAGGI